MDDGCLFLNNVDFVRIWLTYFAEKVVVFHEKGPILPIFLIILHSFGQIFCWDTICIGVAVEMMPHIAMC